MASGQLQRRLGLVSAISITVGAVIGSGIFLKPLSVAQALPSEAWIHVMWIGLGLVCLFGAFAYAELGAMFPEAGGQYAFLREGWGRMVAFLYGWTFFWVINAGTIAALALGFAENLLPLFGVDMVAEKESPRNCLGSRVCSWLVLCRMSATARSKISSMRSGVKTPSSNMPSTSMRTLQLPRS